MQTSAQGVAALQAEEGTVLRAYRDAVGRWTIGDGLTAASGVVKPKAGMVITKAEAANLLQRALRNNYEPAVGRAMTVGEISLVPGVSPKQHEFDAAVSFHFNTGAIGRASWVKQWRAKAASAAIRVSMVAWNKGGGKVLPGLTARRHREADMLMFGKYRTPAKRDVKATLGAAWGLQLSGPEIIAAREGFRTLGYDVGPDPSAVLRESARKFQADHGLTVDGIIGRATLSTLQRRLDARTKTVQTAVASAPAGASAGVVDQAVGLPHVETLIWVCIAVSAAWLAWRYRDVVAAKVSTYLPRLAALLRSV